MDSTRNLINIYEKSFNSSHCADLRTTGGNKSEKILLCIKLNTIIKFPLNFTLRRNIIYSNNYSGMCLKKL